MLAAPLFGEGFFISEGGTELMLIRHGQTTLRSNGIWGCDLSLICKNLVGRLDTVLPLSFPGGFHFEAFSDFCSGCESELIADHWMSAGAWLSARSCVLDLTAECPRCGQHTATKIRLRANDDGTAEIDQIINGRWETSGATNTTFWDRIRIALAKMFSFMV